ncbi:MAG TPA: hypothetical protein VML96_10670 [Egibacteraceae bacterium]|nr:hypothetical protein [Egibacteraceae bacterium]
MSPRAQLATAGVSAGTGLLATLGLSFVFPALASPMALAVGAAAGVGLAFRDRLPHESPAFRLGLAALGIASAVVIWLSLQPGYIGI